VPGSMEPKAANLYFRLLSHDHHNIQTKLGVL
jgi:hypothetical protein